MSTDRHKSAQRSIWLSPYLLAVALTPAFVQIDYSGCAYYGDSRLTEFELIVDGENRITEFDPNKRSYEASLPAGASEARVVTVTRDPRARVSIFVLSENEGETYLDVGIGGSDVVVSIPPGTDTLQVWVAPSGRATDYYEVSLNIPGFEFPCTEQGILDAIEFGGGPHTFDCDGPTTVYTNGPIIIDKDVILDGGENLTISQGWDRWELGDWVLEVLSGKSELMGITIAGSRCEFDGSVGGGITIGDAAELSLSNSDVLHAGGGGSPIGCVAGRNISNAGTLRMTDGDLVNLVNTGTARLEWVGFRGIHYSDGAGAIRNEGDAIVIHSTISNYSFYSAGLLVSNSGTLHLVDSTISKVWFGAWGGAVLRNSGTLGVINSTISEARNAGFGPSIVYALWGSGGSATLINSTVYLDYQTEEPEITGNGIHLINSTVVSIGKHALGEGVRVRNSLLVAAGWPCSGPVVSEGGNSAGPRDGCGFTDPSDIENVSAEELALGPLQDNGGLTRTFSLLPGSIAIDWIPAADCVDAEGEPLSADQRGELRPAGSGCDAGAFEVQP